MLTPLVRNESTGSVETDSLGSAGTLLPEDTASIGSGTTGTLLTVSIEVVLPVATVLAVSVLAGLLLPSFPWDMVGLLGLSPQAVKTREIAIVET
jgi:hypothetical protein